MILILYHIFFVLQLFFQKNFNFFAEKTKNRQKRGKGLLLSVLFLVGRALMVFSEDGDAVAMILFWGGVL